MENILNPQFSHQKPLKQAEIGPSGQDLVLVSPAPAGHGHPFLIIRFLSFPQSLRPRGWLSALKVTAAIARRCRPAPGRSGSTSAGF